MLYELLNKMFDITNYVLERESYLDIVKTFIRTYIEHYWKKKYYTIVSPDAMRQMDITMKKSVININKALKRYPRNAKHIKDMLSLDFENIVREGFDRFIEVVEEKDLRKKYTNELYKILNKEDLTFENFNLYFDTKKKQFLIIGS